MPYGVPYKGSKNAIAEQIVDLLPSASTLYDVFAGGCAISHCALLKLRFHHHVLIDSTDIPQVFLKAWRGEPIPADWVSRAEYFKRYKHDPLLKVIWSFGNKPGHYIYGVDIEPYKYAIHSLAVKGQFLMMHVLFPDACEDVWKAVCHIPLSNIRARRLAISCALSKACVEGKLPPGCPIKGRRDAAVEDLERLSRLQSIYNGAVYGKASLEFWQIDYREAEFTDPAGVIYCDPPYKGTDKYDSNFNHEAFYDWCESQVLPVYISEYDMPSDRFECIAAFDKTCCVCATETTHVIEKLWRPRCLPKELYGNI